MKRTILSALLVAASVVATTRAQNTGFLPGQIAVLRAGNGDLDPHLKQSPIFVDQFDPKISNAAPTLTVAIPTNGANAFFFNGHAATEGGLARSADHRILTFAGYGGVDLLARAGTPALLEIQRSICSVDASGSTSVLLYQLHDKVEKMNPRGAVTDGNNHFWNCGNAGATFYLSPAENKNKQNFDFVVNTRAMKIINNALYATLNGPDATAEDKLAGIYRFVDKSGSAAALPVKKDATIELVVPVTAPYTKISGFDMNTSKTIAYLADTDAGIQKYVKTNGAWKMAYNFAIPQVIPTDKPHPVGCFGVAVDFSGTAPVIYATTTEGYNGSVNSNRVVRIVDTSATATVETIAQAPSEKITYRGIEFTPEKGR